MGHADAGRKAYPAWRGFSAATVMIEPTLIRDE